MSSADRKRNANRPGKDGHRSLFKPTGARDGGASELAGVSASILNDAFLPETLRTEEERGPRRGTAGYMPALDGLRALAVLAVIAYHFNLKWAQGGLLGVGLFFVLSGYLITDLLAAQWSASGYIDLKEFWLRRARRLLPALFVMLAGVVVWTALSDPSRLAPVGEDTLAALLYSSNWWFIFHKVSYFASFGPPSPLGHLWSLAVEEQFYLIWPLLLWIGLYYIPRRKHLVGLVLAGACASALAMALLYQPGTDPSRVYYGTDTRAFALLVGAALALAWPSRKLPATLGFKARRLLDAAGGAALLFVLLMIWQSNEYAAYLYRGGLLLFCLAAAVLTAVLAHPASRLGKLFSLPALRWLGIRSYAIYLWHYPVIVLTSPPVNTGGVNILLVISQLTLCIALAALSWRLIEEPVRYGAWRKQGYRLPNPQQQQDFGKMRGWATLFSVLLILGVSCLALVLILHTKNISFSSLSSGTVQTTGVPAGSESVQAPKPAGGADTQAGESDLPSDSRSVVRAETQPQVQKEGELETEPPDSDTASGTPKKTAGPSGTEAAAGGAASQASPETGKGVTAIGDSVMVGAEPALQKLLPGIVVDAKVGRQLYQAQSVIDSLKEKGNLGGKVIIELGTNGPFTEEQLTALLNSLGQGRQIVLVNTRVPRSWEGVVNETLSQVARTYPNTTLVDWYGASGGHNTYFSQDGVHLTPAGIQAYAALVANALNPGA